MITDHWEDDIRYSVQSANNYALTEEPNGNTTHQGLRQQQRNLEKCTNSYDAL